MVHCNNCTSDLNAWVNLFREFAESMGMTADMNRIFGTLYNKALEGDSDCGGLRLTTISQESILQDLTKEDRCSFVNLTANLILQTL